jgi:hypothetical protein
MPADVSAFTGEDAIDDSRERNYLSVSIAGFDVIQNVNIALEGRIEFRFYSLPLPVKPLSGVMINDDGAAFLYVGFLYIIPISSNLYISPSFTPGLYHRSNSKDLGFALEFRSQVEIILKLENDCNVSVGFSHISNASLGRINPGVESLAFSFQVPLN